MGQIANQMVLEFFLKMKEKIKEKREEKSKVEIERKERNDGRHT